MLPSRLAWPSMMKIKLGPATTTSIILILKTTSTPTPAPRQSPTIHTRRNHLEATAAPASYARCRSRAHQHHHTHPSGAGRQHPPSVFRRGILTDQLDLSKGYRPASIQPKLQSDLHLVMQTKFQEAKLATQFKSPSR